LACSVVSTLINRIQTVNQPSHSETEVLLYNLRSKADANEEAEMIIRAIMQDEVDKSVYSKMADDLESAAKRMKKRKVKKVKENPSEIAA